MLTVQDIQKLSPEQIHEMNRVLGRRILTRYLVLFGVKWAVIIGGTRYLAKKYWTPHEN